LLNTSTNRQSDATASRGLATATADDDAFFILLISHSLWRRVHYRLLDYSLIGHTDGRVGGWMDERMDLLSHTFFFFFLELGGGGGGGKHYIETRTIVAVCIKLPLPSLFFKLHST
jgi:hypothetical protein